MPSFLGLKTEVFNFLTLVKRPQMAYMSPVDLSTQEKSHLWRKEKMNKTLLIDGRYGRA